MSYLTWSKHNYHEHSNFIRVEVVKYLLHLIHIVTWNAAFNTYVWLLNLFIFDLWDKASWKCIICCESACTSWTKVYLVEFVRVVWMWETLKWRLFDQIHCYSQIGFLFDIFGIYFSVQNIHSFHFKLSDNDYKWTKLWLKSFESDALFIKCKASKSFSKLNRLGEQCTVSTSSYFIFKLKQCEVLDYCTRHTQIVEENIGHFYSQLMCSFEKCMYRMVWQSHYNSWTNHSFKFTSNV